MYRTLAVLMLVTAAAAVGAQADAVPTRAKQKIAITAKGDTDHFVLGPVNRGALARDSGDVSWCCWSRRFVTRNGQTAEINNPLATFTGARGTFEIRFRIEWLDAGGGYTVGTSTWRLVRGTGDYEGLSGSGRAAQLWIPPDHPASFRAVGFLGPHRG